LKKQINKITTGFHKRKPTPLQWLAFLLAVNFCLFLLLFFLGFLVNTQKLAKIPGVSENVRFSYFQKRPDLLSSSKALVIYDATHNDLLLSKNEDLRFSPASTAKIMASLIALSQYSESDVLTYSAPLVGVDSSRMGLYTGEQISVKNLLYGMMLPSGNDAAKLIAVNFPGGEEEFVKKMNEKAQEIGMKNTYFVDPAGYADENYSTAYDLALLGSYALQNPTLSEIVKTKELVVYDTSGTIPHKLTNLNELLSIKGVNGIKTGFTNEAEGVLVSSFLYDGTQYVMVVLRSQDRFSDTRELISGIIEDLKRETYAL
jgi:D-alanyl-D-alanine carboxypeptidase